MTYLIRYEPVDTRTFIENSRACRRQAMSETRGGGGKKPYLHDDLCGQSGFADGCLVAYKTSYGCTVTYPVN